MPLILLEPEMQNRRILDHVFESIGAHPAVVAETSGFIAAIAMAREGMGATVLPQVLVDSLGTLGGAVLLPIIEPEVSKPVALVTPRRSRGIPVVEALRSIVAPTGQ